MGLGFDSQLYLVINHKIANDSTTTETLEKISKDLKHFGYKK
jgi:hypothetical protein